jgi:hypothetical protein
MGGHGHEGHAEDGGDNTQTIEAHDISDLVGPSPACFPTCAPDLVNLAAGTDRLIGQSVGIGAMADPRVISSCALPSD